MFICRSLTGIGRRTAAVREETLWRCQEYDAASNHGRTDTSAADFAIILMVFYSYTRTSGPGSGLHSVSPVSVLTDSDELLATMNEDDEWPIECYNNNKTRNPLKLPGVPQTNERISAASGPKFTILWRHVEEILLLNQFFSACRYMP